VQFRLAAAEIHEAGIANVIHAMAEHTVYRVAAISAAEPTHQLAPQPARSSTLFQDDGHSSSLVAPPV
jgi:hypothetical protein